jgi:CheY-like chemotaxis protein
MSKPARFSFPPFETQNGSSISPSPGKGVGALIHIIDDDAPLGAALGAGLEAHGYRTFFSPNAVIGCAEARSQKPDLILCDINMPGKNGHRLLADIRTDAELADCPFVFMTGNPAFAHPRTGMDLGADDFLLKPFSLETLVECVNARLRRKVISQRGETVFLGKLRTSLHSGMSHEFFTPLTGIIGLTEMVEQDLSLMTPGEISQALASIRIAGQRLHRTLRNYLYTVDQLTPDLGAPPAIIPAATVVQLIQQGATTAVQRHRRAGDLTLELAGHPLAAGPQEFTMLLEELVDNACSFSSPGTPVRVAARRVGANLRVTVTDTGRGMTQEQLRRLGAFRQFDREKFEQQGLGVGLFIVRQALGRLAGELAIESTPGQGTACLVSLPVHVGATAAGDN